MLDVAIIGAGPAALTAALYLVRAGLKVEIFEKSKIGGALTEIAKIENYPGFVGAGQELAKNLRTQAESAGAKITFGECESISPLRIDGEEIEAKTILIATGSEPRKLDIELKAPVSYCALCDAPLYKNRNIAVVGGANSALQESLYLAKIAKNVTVFSHSNFKAENYITEKVKNAGNISLVENVEITPELLNEYDGVFVFIGKLPATSFIDKKYLDEEGYIITNNNKVDEGIFVAGDVRSGAIKQAAAAAADGVAAAMAIIEYLKG